MSTKLTSEIVKRIILNVGAAPTKQFGTLGITENIFLVDKKVKADYSGHRVLHNVYAGQQSIGSTTLNAVLFDLTYDEAYEFLFGFKMDELPIHAVNSCWNEENNFVRIFNKDGSIWKNTSIYMQAQLLASFERITSLGVLWNPLKDYHEIYDTLMTLI
jgi:hypothetical protein